MTPPAVPIELWRTLLRQATEIHARRPWIQLSEAQVFGVEVPSRPTSWVQIAGELGSSPSIEIYRGTDGLRGFLALSQANLPPDPANDDDAIEPLEVPRIQIAYLNEEELEAPDREVRDQVGILAAIAGAWPRLRSYRPGFLPWYLDQEECESAILALDRLLVHLRDARFGAVFEPARPGAGSTVDVLEDPEEPRWREDRRILDLPPRGYLVGDLDANRVGQLRQLPIGHEVLDLDLMLIPAAVREGSRPFMPYLLLGVDSSSGQALIHDLLKVETTLEEMLNRIPGVLCSALVRVGRRPATLRVRSHRLQAALQSFCSHCATPVDRIESLPELQRVCKEFLEALRRGS